MRNFLIFLLIALAVVGAYAVYVQRAEAPGEPQAGGRVMDIKTYVRGNINSLSPEPAVLGGTFYVTDIDAADSRGTVSYEDGHIALTADFEYVMDEYGITITSFEVRD